MDAAAKRRNEIEAKKAKLAELRRLREQRQQIVNSPASSSPIIASRSLTSSLSRTEYRADIDQLVSSLVGHDLTAVSNSSQSTTEQTEGDRIPPRTISDPQFLGDQDHVDTIEERPVISEAGQVDRAELQNHTDVRAEATLPVPRIKEVVKYTKGTQTKSEDDEPADDEPERETQDQLIARLRNEIEAEIRLKRKEEVIEGQERETAAIHLESLDSKKLVISEAPENVTVSDNDTSEIEPEDSRAHREIPVDYTRDVETEPVTAKDGSLLQKYQFSDESTKTRMVTSLSWSPNFPELVLASYSKDQKLSNREHGLIHIWNTKSPTRPEFTLFCQSEVQQALFSPHHANIVIGGSHSGQVMIWDIRVKMQPVLATPLTGKGHNYPITALHVVGTKQSASIISASSDGLICVWSPDFLAQPQESFELALLPPNKVEEVTPTALSHTSVDTSTFLAGAEDGVMYSINRIERAGAKVGVDPKISYQGHAAMITGVDHHRCKGFLDFSDLVLTASLDWTLKLWAVRAQSLVKSSSTQGTIAQSALLEIQRDDPVYDVRWSPSRPGVFACVDGSGECHVYDLCKNMETSITSGTPTSGEGSIQVNQVTLGRALNKVIWDHKGLRLAVGGVVGTVTIFSVPETIGGKDAANNEQWHHLKNRLKAAGR